MFDMNIIIVAYRSKLSKVRNFRAVSEVNML